MTDNDYQNIAHNYSFNKDFFEIFIMYFFSLGEEKQTQTHEWRCLLQSALQR